MLFYINEPYGTNLSILGCMSAFGLISLSQQVPTSGRKKQKTGTGVKRGLPHGTNSSHFMLFIEELGFVLNSLGLKNMHIVMSSSPIHRTKEVLKAIKDNSHHACLYLLIHHVLNPIEEFWAKIKLVVRRPPLVNNEVITDRIDEIARKVTAKN